MKLTDEQVKNKLLKLNGGTYDFKNTKIFNFKNK